MDKIIYDLWLSLSVTPGSETFSKLLNKFNEAEEIYRLDNTELVSILGSKSKDVTALSDKKLDKAEEILDFCVTKKVGLLSYFDPLYPKLLKEISSPPVLLYYRGVLPDFDKLFCISVVGTRRLSEYGRRNAFNISFDLSLSGATVVSGMAIGIDGVSHAGALAASKATVAVIGSGIDVCYPKQHKRLAREIVKTGCVFTEYPPGTPPDKNNFPIRNRIISGLSNATLVIEGKERSGALLTARHAKNQGRPLYALPGNVGNPNSQLSNLLIQNGAKLCTSADDIVRDFEMSSMGKLNPFELAKGVSADMFNVLREYEVAAVCADDSIFRPARSKKEVKKTNKTGNDTQDLLKENVSSTVSDSDVIQFDSQAFRIYKKIPMGQECSIESLVDDEFNLRAVMKGLLKLEMGKFVVMLPGEKVRRNF